MSIIDNILKNINNPLEKQVLGNLQQARNNINANETPVETAQGIQQNIANNTQQSSTDQPQPGNRFTRTDTTPPFAGAVNPQQQETPVQVETAPDLNKWGYTPDELEYLAKAGYTADKLDWFNAGFDPSKGENFLQRIYESSVGKPTAPDEKLLKKQRLVSGIADGLGMLSQMWSAGRGAHVKERSHEQSAIAQTAAKERNLRDLYKNETEKYNYGLQSARQKDFLRALDDYNNGRKDIQSLLSAKHRMDQAQAQFEEKQRLAYEKFRQDQNNKDRDFELKKQNQQSLDRHRKAMEAQGWSRVKDSRNRTAAYVKKISSSGNGSGSTYQMVFDANPKDAGAVTDNFGNKLRVFEKTKGEIDHYTRKALSGKDFLRRNPEYDRGPVIPGEALRPFTEKERLDIAAAYLRDEYNKGFQQTPSSSSGQRRWDILSFGNNNPNFSSGAPGFSFLPNDDTEADYEEANDNEDWSWID